MKIDAVLEDTLGSPLAIERLRMERRIMSHAQKEPYEMVPVLLKHYESVNERVRESVRRCLVEIVRSREGLDAVIHSLRRPSRTVRRAVFSFLSENGAFHSVTYASFYEQTMILLTMARNQGIPVDDIETMADVSRKVYLDGEVIQAIRDIATCFDLVKHRHRSVEQLKRYVANVLRLAPDLISMGVYSGTIEEPLRKALKASKERSFNETSELIALRMREAKVREELERLGELVSRHLVSRPEMEMSEMRGTEVWMISRLGKVVDMVTASTLADRREEAMERLGGFLCGELADYLSDAGSKLRVGDPSALFTLYTVGIVCLKLFSYHLPISAEDIYQRCFRDLEGEPSIHIVRWPDVVMPTPT